MAGVVSNLLYPPNINLTQDGSLLESESDDVLTYTLGGSVTGVFTCTVCIEVQEADIMNHCNSSTVTITEDGESFMLIHACIYLHTYSVHSTRTNHSSETSGHCFSDYYQVD